MKTSIQKQLKNFHFCALGEYIIGASIILFLIGILQLPASHLYERYSPSSWWYEYGSAPTTPVKLQYSTGETIKYRSDITYHRTIDIRWEDTMWCFQDDGLKKYPTQKWPSVGSERKIGGYITTENTENGESPFWDYYVMLPDEDATSCYLRSVSIGTTPLGYEKTFAFFTDAVLVNVNE